jgi:hypothetical protein
MRGVVLLSLFLLAGCFDPPTPPLPTTSVVAGQEYLHDTVDEDVRDVYDLVRANFTELNGSVVLSVELRDVYNPVPRLVNVFDVVIDGERRTLYARTIPDMSRPAPHINYELGSIEDGTEKPIGNICGIHGSAETPPRVMFDLPHNMTGLEDGGTLVRLHIEVHDFETETLYDSGDAEKSFAVKGGPNPHETCPLVAERARQ